MKIPKRLPEMLKAYLDLAVVLGGEKIVYGAVRREKGRATFCIVTAGERKFTTLEGGLRYNRRARLVEEDEPSTHDFLPLDALREAVMAS